MIRQEISGYKNIGRTGEAMLHILWMIIKFILILIGILLGLALLALLLLLFCPVRYQAEGTKEADSFRTVSGKAKVSWLFGGISFSLGIREGQKELDFRLFGIPILKLLKKLKNRKKKANAVGDIEANFDTAETDQGSIHKSIDDSNNIETKQKNLPEFSGNETTYLQGDAETLQASDLPEETDEEMLSDPDAEKERKWKQIAEKLKTMFYNLGNKTRKIWEKLKAVYQKIMHIPEDIEKFSRKKQDFCDKIDWWRAFAEHPRTQKAISLVKSRAFRLLRHVFPTKIEGRVLFDCTDPSITGAVLAFLGMTIPLHRNCIQVTPLFENRNVLYGNARLKGRIYGFMLARTALELYFDKNTKYVIRRWKHK